MTQIDAVEINPSLLVWARETAGLTIEDAAKKIGVSIEKLAGSELGNTQLSFNQLRKAATVYKRSLGLFFLPEPPETPNLITDFRGQRNVSEVSYSSELRFQIRHSRYRRKLALEMYEELGYELKSFDLKANLDESPEAVGQRIRDWLGVTIEEQRSWKGEYDSLNGWLLILESKSVLVFQTKDVDREEMLGACMYYQHLPIILLNGKFHPNSKVFTLMHELAHLCLGASGVSAQNSLDSAELEGQYANIERFCNFVAGEVLLPKSFLLEFVKSRGYRNIDDDALLEISRTFGVSREVALRRLSHTNMISYGIFQDFLLKIRDSYKSFFKGNENKNARPDFHRIVIRDNGFLFTRLVCDAYESSKIGAGEFSSYLDVSNKHTDKIIDAINKRAPRA